MTKPTSTPIPQHRAVKACGPATVNKNIQFKGRRHGVVLHNRDTDLIGYPIPLDTGKYLVATKFGRHYYHEDAGPMYVALGRIAGERAARKAYAEHGPTQRKLRQRSIEAASENIGDDGWGRPDAGEVGEKIAEDLRRGGYGMRFYASTDGTYVVSCRSEYDYPESYQRVRMSPDALKALFAGA